MTVDPMPTERHQVAGDGAVARVAVCDDQSVVHEGLNQIIGSADGFRVVLRAWSADELVEGLRECVVDVCVLDDGLPDRDGAGVLPEVLALCPGVKILVFTNRLAAKIGMSCFEAGASGFLHKSATPTEIVDALAALRRGDVAVPDELVPRLLPGNAAGAPHRRLSAREWDVFVRLAQGVRVRVIAEELGLDDRTVTATRRRVLDKLGIEHNAGLTAYALLHELVDADALVRLAS